MKAVYFALFLSLCIPLSHYIKLYFKKYDDRFHTLLRIWQKAKQERIEWRKDHYFDFNFDNPEYQKLWHIEIGAEINYIITFNNIIRHKDSESWQSYLCEKSESEREKS